MIRTCSVFVNSHEAALIVCQGLIDKSQWFEVTPFPMDRFEISAKIENVIMLSQLASGAEEETFS